MNRLVVPTLIILLSPSPAQAGDSAGPALDEPQGRPVVLVQDYLWGDPVPGMGVAVGAPVSTLVSFFDDDPNTLWPGWTCGINTDCGGGSGGETTPPPAQVPLPAGFWLALTGLFSLLTWALIARRLKCATC